MSERLVSVAVPVALDRGFTYRVPEGVGVEPGARVLAPFGSRALTGVIRPAEAEPPEDAAKLRDLLGRLDSDAPSLTPDVVELCEWIAEYYVAPVGEVYRLALPGLLTNADARTVALTDPGAQALGGGPLLGGVELDDRERRLLDRVGRAGSRGIGVARLSAERPRIASALTLLGDLEARGLVAMAWDDATPQERSETFVRRTDYLREAGDEDDLKSLLGRSKQRRALLDHIEARADDEGGGWIELSALRGPFPRLRQLLPGLVEARLVVTRERPRRLDPFAVAATEPSQPLRPTDDQAAALRELSGLLSPGEYASALLHGITGSGKTEVYLQLIAEVRERGRGAIVLVPEIALTPQLADRFRARFGDDVAVLHSGLTPRGRLDAWQQIRSGTRRIVIGARSAVFAPVEELGIIVVDEEHDGSFKQEEGVRYNARDVALVRGRNVGVLVVMGSATPALETYQASRAGRHRYLRLATRPTPRPLPKVEIVPLAVHRPDPQTMLTGVMRRALLDTIAAKEQAILFLNRRGFTTAVVCEACGSFQQCPDCSAPSMTYHLKRNRLMCHLCGHIEGAPSRCSECGGTQLGHGGVGTEKVELAISRELEGARVLRLDRDAARGRQLLHILDRFRKREADVLVGTQMLSKGHDFPGVTLVGILAGDHGLGLPDPRAAERTFDLLTQVAGRAGRGERPGRVLVQAWAIEHPAIRFAATHDYEGFAEVELAQREKLGNPPSGHLALIRVQGLEAARVQQRAREVARFIGEGLPRVNAGAEGDGKLVTLLGPVASPIEKINRRTRWQMLLRARARAPLRWLLAGVRAQLGPRGHGASQTSATVDVDPQSLL